MAIKLLIY